MQVGSTHRIEIPASLEILLTAAEASKLEAYASTHPNSRHYLVEVEKVSHAMTSSLLWTRFNDLPVN